jgi:hydroxymethylbilane synthase
MLVVAMANDEYSRQALHELNDIDTEICTLLKDNFLNFEEVLVGALAVFVADDIVFKAFVFLWMVKEKSKLKTVPCKNGKIRVLLLARNPLKMAV